MPLLSGNAASPPTTIDERVQPSPHRSVEEVPRHLAEHHDQESQLPHPPLHKVDLEQARAKHEQEHYDNSHNQQEHSTHQELQLRRESQTQLSDLAQLALFNSMSIKLDNTMPAVVAPAPHPIANLDGTMADQLKVVGKVPATLAAPERPSSLRHRHTDDRVGFAEDVKDEAKPRPMASGDTNGHTTAMNDTPATTAPSSPSM